MYELSRFLVISLAEDCPGFKLSLEELWNVEYDGEQDDGHDVAGDPPPGVGPVHDVVVLDGTPDGAVTLQGQHHRDVDARAEDHVVKLKQRLSVKIEECVIKKKEKKLSNLIEKVSKYVFV